MSTPENSSQRLLDILNNVELSLQNFTSNVAGGGNDWLLSPFGDNYDEAILFSILTAWNNADFSNLPEIEIISSNILGNANGGYSQQTNTIYLADNFLNNAQPYTIEGVILEEIGHWIDAQINVVDSAGDEGAIFSALVQGNTLTENTLTQLKAEDDSATIIVDGHVVEIEMSQSFSAQEITGWFFDVVKCGGLLAIDLLGGKQVKIIQSVVEIAEGFGEVHKYLSYFTDFADVVTFVKESVSSSTGW